MATSRANVMQTAFNVASEITAAQVQAGILADADSIKTTLFTTADEVFAKLEAERGDADEPQRRSSGGGGRGRSGGKVTLEDALDTKLKFGAFRGLTLRKVASMKASEAEEYNYTNGTGKDYIKWLAESNENEFMAKRAALVLEDLRAGSAEE